MSCLVSIIVPVYNIEKYLGACIDSIVNQTYDNIEIVLVDDGSNDSSRDICNLYAENDKRIKVIHKKNEGLVEARKTGLKACNGAYIMPVDGDDYIESTIVEKMIEIALNKSCDIVQCGTFVDYLNGDRRVVDDVVPEGFYDLTDNECSLYKYLFKNEEDYTFGRIRSNVWSTMFTREIVYDIQMNVPSDIVNGEDDACFYPCILTAKSFYKLAEPLYHYRRHSEAMTKVKACYHVADVLKLDEYIMPFVERHPAREIIYSSFKREILSRLNYHAFMDWNFGYQPNYLIPYDILPSKGRFAVYGAGDVGKSYISQIKEREDLSLEFVLWIDKENGYSLYGYDVMPIEELKKKDVDFILLAAVNELTANSMKHALKLYDIEENKIFWKSPKISACSAFLNIGGY